MGSYEYYKSCFSESEEIFFFYNNEKYEYKIFSREVGVFFENFRKNDQHTIKRSLLKMVLNSRNLKLTYFWKYERI